MGVDATVLEAKIDDIAAGDAELKKLLLDAIGKKDDVAVRFVDGFERHADYTRGKQTLADEKKALADEKKKMEASVSSYEERIQAADTDKQKILKDLAGQRLTASKAMALLTHVKETYGLTDEDIPSMGDLIDTRKSGKVTDSTPDLEERLKAFGTDLEKSLLDKLGKNFGSELGSMVALDVVWDEINADHKDLFGKRLTKAEKLELIKDARASDSSIEDVWLQKYKVGDKRLEIRDESNKKKWRDDWEKEQADKRTKEALEGVRPGSSDEDWGAGSPVFRKKFAPEEERKVETTEHKEAPPIHQERLSGADRAKVKFMERRKGGIPMGQPEKKTA